MRNQTGYRRGEPMAQVQDDLLGYVRVCVYRQRPLSDSVFAHLDTNVYRDDPCGTIGRLYLRGKDFVFVPTRMSVVSFDLPVFDCVVA